MPMSCVSGVVGDDGRELTGVGASEPASEKGFDYKNMKMMKYKIPLMFILVLHARTHAHTHTHTHTHACTHTHTHTYTIKNCIIMLVTCI